MSTNLEDVARALPDYDIDHEIGRGQFGIVWSGRHRQLGREVAVKQLAGPATPEYRARFRREARLLAQIDHPHVVVVYDYREHDDLRLLVMELLVGGTLADRRAAGVSFETAIASALAAASGLYHVHTQGILHRDVKPENLMFDRRGTLKVTDFGVARVDLVEATAINVTHAGEFFGTPAYVSPEQAAHALTGTGPPVGAAADQYSLAAVLYETLSGSLTHDASGGAIALCTRRMNEDARPLREFVPGMPDAIDAVVMRALARDPAARYPTIEDFAVALATATTATLGADWLARSEVQVREAGPILDAASGRVAAPPPPLPPPRSQGSPRSRLPILVGAVVVLALVAVAAILISRRDSSSSASPPPTSVPAGAKSVQLEKRWSVATGGPVLSSPAVLGDLVIAGSDDASVRALDAATGAVRWKRATGGPVQSSPTVADGRVFVGSNDGNLYALDLANGNVAWKAPIGYTILSSPAVSAGMVVVGSNILYAFDAATGLPRWTFAPHDVIVSSPAVADGVVVIGSNDHNVYGVGLSDGRERWHFRTADAVQSSPAVADGVVYVGSVDGFVYALDVATGKNRWSSNLGAPVKATPAVASGRVFAATVAGKFVALDAATGKVQWTFAAPDPINSSPAIVGNLVVVGSNDGKVYALNVATGTLAGSFKTGGPVVSSPQVVGDGVVVGSNDNSVYEITGFTPR